METTFRIHTDQLTIEIIENIKYLFPNKMVDITVHQADETDYILENPAYTRELEERIKDYETKKQVISVKAEELL